MRRILIGALAALSCSVFQSQADVPQSSLRFLSGYSGLSGNALESTESPGGSFSSARYFQSLHAQNGWWLGGSVTLTGVDAHNFGDSFNQASEVELSIGTRAGDADVSAFAGLLHSEQNVVNWRSSRRMYWGLDWAQPLGGRSELNLSVGYLTLNGGTDGRGRQSLTDAPFFIVGYSFSPDDVSTFNVEAGFSKGRVSSNFGASAGYVREIGISYDRVLKDNLIVTIGARASVFQTRARQVVERQIFVGITRTFGAAAKARKKRPLSRWVAQTGGPLF
jgi:hypothetical protein